VVRSDHHAHAAFAEQALYAVLAAQNVACLEQRWTRSGTPFLVR
jgi:hypothetical protein